jgi:hypothetical protein
MRRAAAVALIAACVHSPVEKEPEAPRKFLLRLLEVSHAGDVVAWRGLMSRRMRERNPDDDSAFAHMHVWGEDLKQHEGEIRAEHCVLGDRALECGHFILKVAIEGGELRIDEN